MLNALEPGTVMPIHRHKSTSETCVCLRGYFEEFFYDENGNLTDTINMVPGGAVVAHGACAGERLGVIGDEGRKV